MSGTRVRILCEDRNSERFLRRLCERHGVQVLEVVVAPRGNGSASAWVLSQYPDHVRQRRSQNFQANLGLIVHVDGDNQGVTARKVALDAALIAASLPTRQVDEPVAVCVPTWCIETWLLHLAGLGQPAEAVQVKEDPTWRTAVNGLETNKAAFRQAVERWKTFASPPPSLADWRVEAQRVGIT